METDKWHYGIYYAFQTQSGLGGLPVDQKHRELTCAYCMSVQVLTFPECTHRPDPKPPQHPQFPDRILIPTGSAVRYEDAYGLAQAC